MDLGFSIFRVFGLVASGSRARVSSAISESVVDTVPVYGQFSELG